MSTTIDVAFVHAFDANLHVLGQQKESVLRDGVRIKTGVVGKSYHFERIGAVDMVKLTSRHQDTPLVNNPHTRRRVTFDDFALADLIDDVDEVKLLISPESAYAQNFARARNRKLDDLIIAAFSANAIAVGADDTTSSVALPAGQQIANGGTNMTMAKIRQAGRILNVNQQDEEDRYFAYSPQAMEKLLADSTVTSSDFSTIQALMRGGFARDAQWMGFKWRMSTRLGKVGNIRSCWAWQKNSTGLAVLLEKSVEMDKRPDKNNSTQVLLKLSGGATRIEDEGVVQVDIDESA